MWKRNTLRMHGFDYRSPGAYFVTLCAEHRSKGSHRRLGDRRGHSAGSDGNEFQWVFGDVVEGTMVPSPAGALVAAVWATLPSRFPFVRLDAFVVMPDHFHGILWLTGEEGVAPTTSDGSAGPRGTVAHSLGRVIQAFKSESTFRYILGVRAGTYPPYLRRLWQRNYWDTIIRGEDQLFQTRAYIEQNPKRWYSG